MKGYCRQKKQQATGRRLVRAQHYSMAGLEAGGEVGRPGLVGRRARLYLEGVGATRGCEAGNGMERRQRYHPSL